MENLLLENGSKLLLENGKGIFLESYVPPEQFITSDVVVNDAVVSTTLRVNTPKVWDDIDVEAGDAVVGVTGFFSSDPDKFMTSAVLAGEAQVTTSGISVTSPRHYRPETHYIWVYDIHGNKVNVIT